MSETNGIDGGPVDVLVVDDRPNVASSTADVLRSEGLKASTAGSVKDALRIITTHDVKSVILDHRMGEGEEYLLDSGRDLPPIIVMSGLDRDTLAKMQSDSGDRFFACLAKPVPPLDLIEVVKAAIGSRDERGSHSTPE